jgi:hypothetical protein
VHHAVLRPVLCPVQAGQTATQVASAPKSAAKGKKAAAAGLSEEGRAAVALVEAAAGQLPEVDKDRWAAAGQH